MTHGGRGILGVNKKDLKLNLIGQFVLNTFDNKVFPEVKILAFDSEVIENKAEEGWENEEVKPVKATKVTDEIDFDW